MDVAIFGRVLPNLHVKNTKKRKKHSAKKHRYSK